MDSSETRRHHTIQDQENIYAVKGKSRLALPVRRQSLGLRGALGDVNTNVQAQRDVVGKVACAAAEYEKKTTPNRVLLKSNYSHVQSKVDTGLAAKAAKSTAKPTAPLQWEKSTAGLAARTRIQDQENIYAAAGKSGLALPVKRQGLGLRGALGDVNTNVQAQRDVVGKVACAAAEYKKKTTPNRVPLKSNYSYVQSKVDTGLTAKAAKSTAKPTAPLRWEESTAGLAARAMARTRAALKETLNKTVKTKESSSTQFKKVGQELKKPTRVPALKENAKGKENKETNRKVTVKDPTESLGLAVSKCVNKTVVNLCVSPKIQLPKDIEDIDASDKQSPLLMSIYIKDIYKYLTDLEIQFPIEQEHSKKQSVITGKMRATLIDWLVELQGQFSLDLETFHLTVGIIDRYLQTVPNVQRNRLQLIGVAAMYIASKYEETYPPDVTDFVYMTDNAYTEDDLLQCEWKILSKLDFCLARPIPLSFLRRFVKAAHETSKHYHLAKYFVDLCLVEYTMAHYPSSQQPPSTSHCTYSPTRTHLLSNQDL